MLEEDSMPLLQTDDNADIEESLYVKTPISKKKRSFINKYDWSFLILLSVTYFSQGLKVLSDLAAALMFKDYYKLEPSETQYLASVIALPWCLKIFYGMISDNVAIFNSKRRSYLLIFSCISTAVMHYVVLYRGHNHWIIVACLFL